MIVAGEFFGTPEMVERRAIRYVVVSVALLALLFVTATLGGIWHHHSKVSDANCSICHLNHQPMERPLASHREPALTTVGHRPDPQEPGFTLNPETPRLPTRAPPSA
jgi:hypothetical protein